MIVDIGLGGLCNIGLGESDVHANAQEKEQREESLHDLCCEQPIDVDKVM